MIRSVRAGGAPAIALAALLALLVIPLAAEPSDAHGSTQRPASRIYTCRFEQQNNPMCTNAWAANPQALYDWMEVNIGDVGGRHKELIPDGQLCSAGRAKYGAFDRPGEWPATSLTTDGTGNVNLVYENTAPHATAYYRVYITEAGFDARTDALGWGDLDLVYDSGPLDRSATQTMRAPLPDRTTPAVLYIVWQRSDSPEAFYACSDVTVNAGSAAPPPSSTPEQTTTTNPPTSNPPTTNPPTTNPPTTNPPTTNPQATNRPATVQAAADPQATNPQATDPVETSPQTIAESAGGQTKTSPTDQSTTLQVSTTHSTNIQSTNIQSTTTKVAPAQSVASQTVTTSVATSTTAVAESAELRVAETSPAGVSIDSSSSADLGPLQQQAAPAGTDSSEKPRTPFGLAMIGLGSMGLVLMGVGLRWPRRIFP